MIHILLQVRKLTIQIKVHTPPPGPPPFLKVPGVLLANKVKYKLATILMIATMHSTPDTWPMTGQEEKKALTEEVRDDQLLV